MVSMMYASVLTGISSEVPIASTVSIRVHFDVLFMSPVMWHNDNGTGVRGKVRTTARSSLCVTAKNRSLPNISRVHFVSLICLSLVVKLNFTAS